MPAPPESPPSQDPALLKLFEEAFEVHARRKASMSDPERGDILVDELHLAVARFLGRAGGGASGEEICACAVVLVNTAFQTLCARLGKPPPEVWNGMCDTAATGGPRRLIVLPDGSN